MDRLIKLVLSRRWGEIGVERGNTIEEAFSDVNSEAVARALLNYQGNFPPYPKDIEKNVYLYDIDGMFQKGIRKLNGITKEEQLEKIRRGIMEDIRNGNQEES